MGFFGLSAEEASPTVTRPGSHARSLGRDAAGRGRAAQGLDEERPCKQAGVRAIPPIYCPTGRRNP